MTSQNRSTWVDTGLNYLVGIEQINGDRIVVPMSWTEADQLLNRWAEGERVLAIPRMAPTSGMRMSHAGRFLAASQIKEIDILEDSRK